MSSTELEPKRVANTITDQDLFDLRRSIEADPSTFQEGDPMVPETIKKWRQLVSVLLSKSQREIRGDKSAVWLREAREVIDSRYQHPSAQPHIDAITASGNAEYHMRAEMLRDNAKYFMYASALTGHTEFMDLALDAIHEAVMFSPLTSNVHSLAQMEAYTIKRKITGSGEGYRVFKQAYADVVRTGKNNVDRVASASRSALLEGLWQGDWQMVKTAQQNLKNAFALEKQTTDGVIDRNPLTYIVEEFPGRRLLTRVRRLTSNGVNAQEFHLSR